MERPNLPLIWRLHKKRLYYRFGYCKSVFRTKDAAEKLESHGIKLISLNFKYKHRHAYIALKIHSALQSGGNVVIGVVGGDDRSRSFGSVAQLYKDKPYEMIFVINKFRPLTSNAEDVISLLRSVEEASRLKVLIW